MKKTEEYEREGKNQLETYIRWECITTKQWLMRFWHIVRKIDVLLSAKQKAFDRCVSTTVRPKEAIVPGVKNNDPMVQYLDLEKKIDERADELHMVKEKSSMPSTRCLTVRCGHF